MKKIFELTNRYIIIATPLLLFLLLLSIFFMVVMGNSQILKLLLGLILSFLMLTAFAAGWGNMIKSAVEEKNYDEPYMIIKDFAPGVGEYFLSVFGSIILMLFIFGTVFVFAYYLGMHFIGDVGVQADALTKAMSGSAELKSFLLSLSDEQLLKLNLWNTLVLSAMSLIYFSLMFYFPAIFYESKNPFKALIISFKRLFGRKFISNIGIYLLIFSINFFISILSALLAKNNILSFIMTLVNFYFICCVVTGIFYYYSKSFIDSHLGTSIDTYV